jgi:hypothetical protein
MEFFLGFYDLIKEDLTKGNLGISTSKKVLGSLNNTFYLFPNKRETLTFEDFKKILSYNMIYKLISKTIANRLNPILSKLFPRNNLGSLIRGKFMML